MKKSELEKRVSKVLNEEETFMLSIILLSHMHGDTKYKNLSDLIFLFDNYKGFKDFIKFYEGELIAVPTIRELKQALRLLTLFQRVYIDKKDFDMCYEQLDLMNLGVSKQECQEELERFKDLLKKDGSSTLTRIRRLSKKFNKEK